MPGQGVGRAVVARVVDHDDLHRPAVAAHLAVAVARPEDRPHGRPDQGRLVPRGDDHRDPGRRPVHGRCVPGRGVEARGRDPRGGPSRTYRSRLTMPSKLGSGTTHASRNPARSARSPTRSRDRRRRGRSGVGEGGIRRGEVAGWEKPEGEPPLESNPTQPQRRSSDKAPREGSTQQRPGHAGAKPALPRGAGRRRSSV